MQFSSEIITPIQSQQRKEVVAATEKYIFQAGKVYKQTFPVIPVFFDLKGRVAGMYKVKNGQRIIRYNPYLFAKYFDDNLSVTVPHEVAHYITDMLHGRRFCNHTIKPHGREWREVMALFNVDANATGNCDLTGIPVRNYRQFEYSCACRSHRLTAIRHNRISRGVKYLCRYCRGELVAG